MPTTELTRTMKPGPKIALLNYDTDHVDKLMQSDRVTVLERGNAAGAVGGHKVLVFLAESHLADASDVIHGLVKRNALAALLIHLHSDQLWVLQQSMMQARVLTLKHTHVHSSNKVRQRVLRAWASGEQDSAIADAALGETSLLIKLCNMETIAVPTSELKNLAKLSSIEWSRFEVSPSGSHIYWPSGDLHVDVDSFRSLADPEYRRKTYHDKLMHDRAFGKAVARLRLEAKLTQSDIQGLSDRQVRRIESGESVSAAAVARLAGALDMNPNVYMHRIAKLIQSDDSETVVASSQYGP